MLRDSELKLGKKPRRFDLRLSIHEAEKCQAYLTLGLLEIAAGGKDNHTPEGYGSLNMVDEVVFCLVVSSEKEEVGVVNK